MLLINSRTQSGIITWQTKHAGLWGSAITIANVATEQICSLSMHGGSNWVHAGPDMVMALLPEPEDERGRSLEGAADQEFVVAEDVSAFGHWRFLSCDAVRVARRAP